MITCPTCQSSNEESATFCDQCGASLSGAAPVASPPQPPDGSTCPSCGAQTMPGEAFCDSCGAALAGAAPQSAAASSAAPTPPPQPPISPAQSATPAAVPAAATSAQVVASNGQTFMLSGKNSYLLGREDPVSGIYPDVDTTGTGGEDSGVSRRHAEIQQNGTQWILRDLGSTNGTFINNQRLAANSQGPLNPGDQIRLGTWAGTFRL